MVGQKKTFMFFVSLYHKDCRENRRNFCRNVNVPADREDEVYLSESPRALVSPFGGKWNRNRNETWSVAK